MLRFAADENFNNDILRGLIRRNADLDIVRIQDVGLSGQDDPTVLEWAAQEKRVLLTHDVSTITDYAYQRVREGKPMPGVFEVGRGVSIGKAIEDILLLAEYSLEDEWEGQIRYLPLR
jgi:predicted nuclease of predicted toxin-antitoxin system